MPTLLLIAVFFPLAAAALPGGGLAQMRWRALAASLVSLTMAAIVISRYPPGGEDFALVDVPWLAARGAGVDVRFSLALDGLSLWLFGLTAVLMVVAVLIGWDAIRQQFGLYYRLLMVLETGLLGVFVARDIILFYLFFEFTLLPLFFLIGVWGSQQRRYAAIKFFLFTLAGSVLTLLGLLAIVLWDWGHAPAGAAMTFSIPELTRRLAEHPIDPWLQTWIFLALFAGFAVKTPLFPLHTWLPLAHVEAPAAGSVLAGRRAVEGRLLRLRPLQSSPAPPGDGGADALALVALGHRHPLRRPGRLAQSDMKRLIAYSSVSHLGFCMLGVFALNRLAVQGGVLQMVNHGLTTGGLFAVVGMLYDRYHTREIADFGGLARQTPRLAAAMVFLALASIGLPGLNGFAGEFLILLGMFQRGWAEAPPALAVQYRAISVLAVAGVVLGAWYMLGLVRRVFFGPLREPTRHGDAAPVGDLGLREVFALAPLGVLIVWIGVQPEFFLRRMSPTLDRLAAAARKEVPLSLRERDGVRGIAGRSSIPLRPQPATLSRAKVARSKEKKSHAKARRRKARERRGKIFKTIFPALLSPSRLCVRHSSCPPTRRLDGALIASEALDKRRIREADAPPASPHPRAPTRRLVAPGGRGGP